MDENYPAYARPGGGVVGGSKYQTKESSIGGGAGHYSPSGNSKRDDKENAGWRGGEPMGTGSLNEVKNRLAQMQKNKQELEEKLRNYEAKIRSHFNK